MSSKKWYVVHVVREYAPSKDKGLCLVRQDADFLVQGRACALEHARKMAGYTREMGALRACIKISAEDDGYVLAAWSRNAQSDGSFREEGSVL